MNTLQSQLTVRKREQLLKFAKSLNLRSKTAPLPVITHVERGERVWLSSAQQRLWLLAQVEGESKAYYMPFGMRLLGRLNTSALKRALDRIVMRHETLRTTFIVVEEEPWQQITAAEQSRYRLLEQDLRQHEEAERELRRMMVEEAGAEFDLAAGPLIRGRLIRVGEEEHVLLITMHHIVSDGWSMGVLFKELAILYGAYVKGEEDPLPELVVQYADYAVWQRKWMEGEVLQRQGEYWKGNLAGIPELLELPTDHPRPARQDHAGSVVEFVLDEKLTAGLKELSARHGTTLYMTLLAGWAVLLARLSGQQDVVIGTPVANRGRVEIENLIGFFVNTLVMRVDVSGRPTVGEVLGRVKKQAIAGQQHQDLPFEQVVEIVQPVRSLAHSPLFQVMFAWQDSPGGRPQLAGLTIEPLPTSPHVVSKFDMTLALGSSGQKIEGGLEYATALFEAKTIKRYLGYFRRLLEGMVAGGENQAVDDIALLGEEERRQVVHGWNQTERELPGRGCMHELFEAEVEKRPDATAVEYEGEQLSYGELNAEANRLGHYLRKVGVGVETRVGVCLERSIEMVVALLGVLKAGGAYVPLDPTYPVERLRYMLQDSNASVLLTQGDLQGLFADGQNSLLIINVLDENRAWNTQPETNLDCGGIGLSPKHLAYVIYTSGSTGAPKGVMNEHQGIVNRLLWMQSAYELNLGDAVLQKTPFSFDVSVWEFFWPLLAGAKLVIARPEGHKDPGYLVDTIRQNNITTLHFVPPMLQALLEHGEEEQCPTLTRVICSGEALPSMLVRRFQEQLAHVQLHNLYGPTEAAVDVTAWTCPNGKPPVTVPIGSPIANTQMYVLDVEREPAPMGINGELHIGGVQVARGYLNRPELTAERFVPDTFLGKAGTRVYRTGDLGRWREDGTIEFLGRNDFQVKIRGFRIELEEIEARLLEHEGVKEAVVVAREDLGEHKRLVAYYTAREIRGAEGGEKEGRERVGAERLRAYIAEKLPEYMVPTAYTLLERMPVTANGKVDRKAFPAPKGNAFGARAHEAPQGEIETIVAGIWADVLKVERVGRHDNFFELGGHSLLAMRLMGRLRQALGIELALGVLFVHPVLSDLAQVVGSERQSRLLAITRADRTGRLPLSFVQQRLWFLAQLQEGSRAYHMPLGVRLRGRLDPVALKRALDQLVARHEPLRTTFILAADEPEQRIAPPQGSQFQLLEHDLRLHPDSQGELERVMTEEAEAGLDLGAGPLIRGRLIRVGEEEHVLLITMHHIVSDGWSIEVLFRDLGQLYGACIRGAQDPLPELVVQYADYAVWQRKWMEGEVLQRQGEYWKGNLAGIPELLELPTDHPRPARQDHAGSVVEFVLDEKLTAGLKELSARHGTTLYMTLLAGWAVLLARLSGQQDVVIGTPVANRGRVEIENLIGFFVNTLVMRVDVSGRPTVGEVLGRVKKQAIAAQQHQDLPFEQVVEMVQPVRSLAHSPLFQVMFAWQPAVQGMPQLAELEIGPVQASHVISKFDMTLALESSGQKIEGGLEYATALFEAKTIKRYLGYFNRLLEGMVAGGENQAVDDIALLGEEERRQVVHELSQKTANPVAEKCLQELFEKQADRMPEAVALEYEAGNKRAMPAPEREAYALGQYDPPQGKIETALARIWSEVLKIEHIGRKDNFFRLGGHSLLTIRVVNLLKKESINIVALDLFAHPTIESLAVKIELQNNRLRADGAVCIRKGGSETPLFFVHDGLGELGYAPALCPYLDASIPVYGLPASSRGQASMRTIEGMAQRMVRMILEVQPNGPYRIAGWSFGGVLAYQIATQLIGADETVEFVGLFDSTYFAGTDGPIDQVLRSSNSKDILLALMERQLHCRPELARGEELQAAISRVRSRAPRVDMATLVQRFQEMSLAPEGWNHLSTTEIEDILAQIRSYSLAVSSYSAQRIPIPVHLFVAQDSNSLPLLGWNAVLPEDQIRVTPVPGTHLSIMTTRNIEILGDAVSRAIRNTAQDCGVLQEKDYQPLASLQIGREKSEPLFCVPGAGASISSFVELVSNIDQMRSVYGFEPRGLEGEHVPYSTVQSAAESYVRALQDAYPVGPIHLLGHSFGGWVAFEMANRLIRRSREVDLSILDSEAPDDAIVREFNHTEVTVALIKTFEQLLERSLAIEQSDLETRSENARMELLHGRLVKEGVLPPRSKPETLRGLLRAFAMSRRTHFKPDKRYLGAVQLILVNDSRLDQAANLQRHEDKVKKWKRWAPNLVHLQASGNHMTILKRPHVIELARLLTNPVMAKTSGSSV